MASENISHKNPNSIEYKHNLPLVIAAIKSCSTTRHSTHSDPAGFVTNTWISW